MIAVPVTNDQPAIAARVQWAGAGEVVPLSKLNAARVRSALERVLTAPRYLDRVQQLQASIARAGGVERAADIVEALLGVSRPTGVSDDQPRPQPAGPDDASTSFSEAFGLPAPREIEQRH